MNTILITYAASKQSIEFTPPQSIGLKFELDYQRHRLMPQGPSIEDIVCFRLLADDGKKNADIRIDASALFAGLRRACERFSVDAELYRVQSWKIVSTQKVAEKRRRIYAVREVAVGFSDHLERLIADVESVADALRRLKAELEVDLP